MSQAPLLRTRQAVKASAVSTPPSPSSPILFFDSGLGGLSVLQPTLELLPIAPVIYATDYRGLPYGEKSEAEVGTRISALLGRLVERFRPRLAVIACNTASTIALSHVRSALDTPFVGTVPAIKPAAQSSRTRVIGLLGTAATVRQPYVDRLIADHAADCLVLRAGAPDLVGVAEAKLCGRAVDMAAVESAVRSLRDQPGGDRLDAVVLACTHFPLIAPELQAAFGPDVQLVDGGAGIARRVQTLTQGDSWPTIAPLRHVIVNGGDANIVAAWGNFDRLGFSSILDL